MGAHADFSLFPPCFAGQAGRQVVRGAAAPPLTVCLLLLFEPETFYTSGLLNEDQISYKKEIQNGSAEY